MCMSTLGLGLLSLGRSSYPVTPNFGVHLAPFSLQTPYRLILICLLRLVKPVWASQQEMGVAALKTIVLCVC